MARLIIVRHAESEHNVQNRIQGHHNSALTKKGVSQARRLAERIRHFRIDRIYSSDLGRAYSTTQLITKYLKRVPIVRDARLREILLGDWEGKTPQEVDDCYSGGYKKWLKSPSKCRIPNSEGIARFRRRITSRVKQIAKQNHGKTVLIVTHGGAITALLSDWLKADFDRLLRGLQIENTSLTFADLTEKQIKLWVINDTDHLARKDKNDERFIHRRT